MRKISKIDTIFIIVIVIVAGFLVNFVFDNYLPSLPSMAEYLKTDMSNIQLAFSIMAIGLGIGNLISGIMLVRLRRRFVCLQALLILIIAEVSVTFAFNPLVLIMSFTAIGIASGFLTTVLTAAICDVFKSEKLAKVNAMLLFAVCFAPLVAPLVGGFIETYLGWRYNFIIPAIAALAVLTLVFLFMPETKQSSDDGDIEEKLNVFEMIKEFFIPLKCVWFNLTVLASIFCYGMIISYDTVGPAIFQKSLHLTPIEYGSLVLFVSGSMLFSSFINTLIIERVGMKRVMLGGAFISLLGSITFMLLYSLGYFNVFVIVIPIMIIIFGLNFAYANTLPIATDIYSLKSGNPATLFVFLETAIGGMFGLIVAYIPSSTQLYIGLVLLVSAILVLILLLVVFLIPYKNFKQRQLENV